MTKNQQSPQTAKVLELATRDLIVFSMLTNQKYAPNWHHEIIAKKLEAVERGDIKRLILTLPPRHGKSELASINFPAWYLGKNPDREIITASYSGDLATDFGGKTRDLILKPEYKAIFPKLKLKEDTRAKQKWSTQEGGGYLSVGVGGAITGRGADIAIIDDPLKNREEADSQLMRDKIYGWYTSTLLTRLETDLITKKKGCIILILTRWHLDDLAGRLIQRMNEGGPKWEIVNLPALAEVDEEHRKTGEPLWGEKYDAEDLKEIRQEIGELDFSALYQQSPILLENATFRPEYFKYFEELEILTKQLKYTISVDLAIGEKKHHDDTAVIVCGKEDSSPNIYVVEVISGHFDPSHTIDLIFSLYMKYRPIRIGIETVAFQKAMVFFLKEEMKKRCIYLPIQELTTGGRSKIERIEGLQPLYATGVIFHRRSYLKLESQLLNFPRGAKDDEIDSLSMQLELLKNTKANKSINMKVKGVINYLTGRKV